MDKEKLIWSATPTPFLADGALDDQGVRNLVEQHVRLGVSGLFVGGTSGEGPFMPYEQQARLVSVMKEHAGDRLHIAAQVSDTSGARAADNVRRMVAAGADSVVVAPPFLVADFCNRAFLLRYFSEAMDAASKPVGVYVRGPLSRMELDLDLWVEVIAHPNVRFVKDSSADTDTMLRLAALRRERPELCLLTGFEFDVLSAVEAGYDGCLMGTAILNAGLIRHALTALAQGDKAAAELWQTRSNTLLYDLFRQDLSSWMAGLKYALHRKGLFSSEFCHLVFPLEDEDRRRIDAALDREAAEI